MRNEIFRQIKNNKRYFYYELNNLKKNTSDVLDRQTCVQPKKTNTPNFKETKKLASEISGILVQWFSKIKPPKLNSRQAGKKVKTAIMKKTSGIMQFIESINYQINKKTDAIIEQFYELGSRVFEDNADSFQSQPNHVELIPDISSNYKVGFNAQKTNEHIVLRIDQFEIMQSLKNLKKNILVYLEADTFNFNKIKWTSVPLENKEITYESKLRDLNAYSETDFEGSSKPELPKTEKLSGISFIVQKISSARSIFVSYLTRSFSNASKLRLFPVLNRFL